MLHSSIRRNREFFWLAFAIVINAVLCVWLLKRNDWLTNVAFLILGALVSVFTTLLSEQMRRSALKRDLANALYVELADRVARCCFDMEDPWAAYLDLDNCSPSEMTVFRVRKFAPDSPLVFASSASQVALLGTDAAQAIVGFYYRLSALQRDIENVATYGLVPPEHMQLIDPSKVRFLAHRLRQTLAPGTRALDALSPFVERYAEIEASSIASYDAHRVGGGPSGTLRGRLACFAQ